MYNQNINWITKPIEVAAKRLQQSTLYFSTSYAGCLRAVLYMAAIVATKYNPDIKRQYERLLKAGKAKMQALGAAMRKLVQICFGVLKHQCEYRPQVG